MITRWNCLILVNQVTFTMIWGIMKALISLGYLNSGKFLNIVNKVMDNQTYLLSVIMNLVICIIWSIIE